MTIPPAIFDRMLHRRRLDRAAAGFGGADFLKRRAAEDIARGELDATLVVGAEAAHSERVSGTGDGTGVRFRPNRSSDAEGGDADPVVGGSEKGYVSRAEVWAGLTYPTVVYPLLESVLAARAGRTFPEQRAFVARFMARFTDVAAKHRCAWFPACNSHVAMQYCARDASIAV